MIDSWNITIPELTGDEPRRAYVLSLIHISEPTRL